MAIIPSCGADSLCDFGSATQQVYAYVAVQEVVHWSECEWVGTGLAASFDGLDDLVGGFAALPGTGVLFQHFTGVRGCVGGVCAAFVAGHGIVAQ